MRDAGESPYCQTVSRTVAWLSLSQREMSFCFMSLVEVVRRHIVCPHFEKEVLVGRRIYCNIAPLGLLFYQEKK